MKPRALRGRLDAQSNVKFGGNGIDSPAENRLLQWVAGRETGPCVMKSAKANSGFNAPNFSRNCSQFVRLPFPETGRSRLHRETQLL